MNTSQFDPPDPAADEQESAGADKYLFPGEQLRIWSSDIQIKKFMFEAYLTSRRLFLIDQHDRKPGVTAKEIPVESILGAYLEDSPAREPVIVISVRTADDDIRLMKMTFAHIGKDRGSEAEEWVHLVAHATPADPAKTLVREGEAERPRTDPVISPEARALSDTMIVPLPGKRPVPDEPAEQKEQPVSSSRQAQRSSGMAPPASQVTTQVLYCFHCGRKLPIEANFCPYCGTKVHQTHHDEKGHLKLPLHQYKEPVQGGEELPKKGGWRRFFGR
ncbi:MAG: zinc ribbon domain-containing protein [Methanoregulaceae archaeon]|nr:zinc ribbon domain-containing protein [Methanoregulaceae archaeon]